MNSAVKNKAWEAQKSAYMSATRNWIDPLTEEHIPHIHKTETEGATIPVYVRSPVNASAKNPVPTILLITGLDGYRPDNTQRSYEFISRGWAVVIVEIPGTADSPADPKDPNSPDRLWDSVFAWMQGQKKFDMKTVVAWGLSCGGYYAVRIAHTHAKQLKGSVAQGAGVHDFFNEAWLRKADDHEYPFEWVAFFLCILIANRIIKIGSSGRSTDHKPQSPPSSNPEVRLRLNRSLHQRVPKDLLPRLNRHRA